MIGCMTDQLIPCTVYELRLDDLEMVYRVRFSDEM